MFFEIGVAKSQEYISYSRFLTGNSFLLLIYRAQDSVRDQTAGVYTGNCKIVIDVAVTPVSNISFNHEIALTVLHF